MKINVFLGEGLIKNEKQLEKFLNKHSKFLNFSIRSTILKPDEDYLVFPQSHHGLYEQLTEEEENSYFNFFFTSTQYNDNYSFKRYKNLVPISFYAWKQLTPLPKENGILYFIIDYIIRDIDKSDFRHKSTTGCIFDSLWDKTGIDDGMRQARVCPKCLSRIKEMNLSEDEKKILEDLKLLMNEVSNSSKWDKNILEEFKYFRTSIFAKRNPKIEGQINIIIASPSDLIEERKILLHVLERRFRADRHEENCGYRLIVHGWEDIASQNGYVQDIINSKITESIDIVLAVFKHTVGTPTLDEYGDIRAESGTIEEFLLTMDDPSTSPLGMLYFYSEAPVISLDSPDSERIKENWGKLKEFKETIRNRVIYRLYSNADELISLVITDLVRNIKDYFDQEGHEEIVERPIQHGTEVKQATTDNGATALMAANGNGHKKTVERRIQHGAEINQVTTNNDLTPLMRASARGDKETVERLIQLGADVNQLKTDKGITALMAAILGGHAEIVERLIQHGADVNQVTTDDGFTALMVASGEGRKEIVERLIQHGADVNQARTVDGCTALEVASLEGHAEIVERLIHHGAKVNQAKTDNGKTALMAASFKGHAEIVERLIHHGAKVNQATTDTGATALMVASLGGHAEIVERLIQHGAKVNQAKTDNGTTALMVASQEGHKEIVERLIHHGAEVNQARTNTGATALMAAREKGHKEIVELLIKHGSNDQT